MTDADLQKEIEDVGESLGKLSKSDKPLTKEEKQHKQRLLVRKDVLYQIKEAKEKHKQDEEIQHSMTYAMLTAWGERHPYLMYLMSSKLSRWNIF